MATPQHASDDGFTIVEILVALVVLMLFATGIAAALVSMVTTSRANENRVVAANLASREIEKFRELDPTRTPLGTSAVENQAVDGERFSVQRQTTLDTAGGTASPCEGSSGPAAFVRATVLVTWDNMGSVAPVRSDTVKSLPVTGLTDLTGVLTVPVRDRDGRPVAGMAVRLDSGQVATTASDGCAVFSGLAPRANVRATINSVGWVNRAGVQSVTTDATAVVAKRVTKHPGLDYDRAATLRLTQTAPAGYPLPPGLGVTLGGPFLSGATRSYTPCGLPGATTPCATVAGTTHTMTPLFPFAEGFTAWTGTCDGARPATPTAVPVAPGAAASQSLGSSGAVLVRTNSLSATGAGGRTLWAVNDACPNGERFAFPTRFVRGPSPTQELRLALPAGTWRLVPDNPDNYNRPGSYVQVTVANGSITTITQSAP